jgi:hypothetical protein
VLHNIRPVRTSQAAALALTTPGRSHCKGRRDSCGRQGSELASGPQYIMHACHKAVESFTATLRPSPSPVLRRSDFQSHLDMASSPPSLPTLPISAIKRPHPRLPEVDRLSGFEILVPTQFALYDDTLRSNQQLVIGGDALRKVQEATMVGIAGFSRSGRICAIIDLPPTELALLASVYAPPPLSLLLRDGLVVSGVFFPPARAVCLVKQDSRDIRLAHDGYADFLDSDLLKEWELKEVRAQIPYHLFTRTQHSQDCATAQASVPALTYNRKPRRLHDASNRLPQQLLPAKTTKGTYNPSTHNLSMRRDNEMRTDSTQTLISTSRKISIVGLSHDALFPLDPRSADAIEGQHKSLEDLRRSADGMPTLHAFRTQAKVQKRKSCQTCPCTRRRIITFIAVDNHRSNSTAESSPGPSRRAFAVPVSVPGSAARVMSSADVVDNPEQSLSKRRRTGRACSQYTLVVSNPRESTPVRMLVPPKVQPPKV